MMVATESRKRWAGLVLVLAGALLGTWGGTARAHDVAPAVSTVRGDASVTQCETRHALRRIGPGDFVVEPQVRCASITTLRAIDGSGEAATDVQPTRTSRFSPSSITVPPESDRVPADREVRWDEGRSHLTNEQGRSSQAAMRDHIVLR